MATVMPLLKRRRPATIAGFITSIVVNAVERQAGRRFSHISKKIFEDQPAFAYGDSPCAVVFEGSVFGIEAASLHTLPTSIYRGWFCLARMAMRRLNRSHEFKLTTATTGGVSALQVTAFDNDLDAAIAANKPMRVTTFSARKTKSGQATEALVGDVSKIRHAPIIAHIVDGADMTRAPLPRRRVQGAVPLRMAGPLP